MADLAWSGQLERAIERATDLLGMPGLPDSHRFELLDHRALSCVSLGRLDEAGVDVAAMAGIARREGNAAFRSRALGRESLVHLRGGDHEAAIAPAMASLEAAQEAGEVALQALAGRRLAEAQCRIGALEAGARNARESARRYAEVGDPAGQGRALGMLALAERLAHRPDEALRAAQAALALCRHTGDGFGVGNALSEMSFSLPDLGVTRRLLRQALVAYEACGDLERQGAALLSLAMSSGSLGLRERAFRYATESGEFFRRANARASWGSTRLVLALLETDRGNLDCAGELAAEAAELSGTLWNRRMAALVPYVQGRIALARGDAAVAVDLLSASATALDEIRDAYEGLALTHLARAHRVAGNAEAALVASTRATDWHQAKGFKGPATLDSPAVIWWEHSRALAALGRDGEADEALETAYRVMLGVLEPIGDEALRRSCLSHVPTHREVIDAWLALAQRRGFPPERRFAHLAGVAGLREPFERLLDTGLRLADLREPGELAAFLVEEGEEYAGAERFLLVVDAAAGPRLAGASLPPGEALVSLPPELVPALERVRRTRAAILARDPPEAPETDQRSRLLIPLVARREFVGWFCAEIAGIYGRFGDADRDMLRVLASQAALALVNAR